MLEEETSCDDFPWDKAISLMEEKIQDIASEIMQLEKQKMELVEFTKVLAEKRCN